jgi:hypothetical protein
MTFFRGREAGALTRKRHMVKGVPRQVRGNEFSGTGLKDRPRRQGECTVTGSDSEQRWGKSQMEDCEYSINSSTSRIMRLRLTWKRRGVSLPYLAVIRTFSSWSFACEGHLQRVDT